MFTRRSTCFEIRPELKAFSAHLAHRYDFGHLASQILHHGDRSHFRGLLRRPNEMQCLVPGGYSIDCSYHYRRVQAWSTVGAHGDHQRPDEEAVAQCVTGGWRGKQTGFSGSSAQTGGAKLPQDTRNIRDLAKQPRAEKYLRKFIAREVSTSSSTQA